MAPDKKEHRSPAREWKGILSRELFVIQATDPGVVREVDGARYSLFEEYNRSDQATLQSGLRVKLDRVGKAKLESDSRIGVIIVRLGS